MKPQDRPPARPPVAPPPPAGAEPPRRVRPAAVSRPDGSPGGDDYDALVILELSGQQYRLARPELDDMIRRFGLTCHVRMEDAS